MTIVPKAGTAPAKAVHFKWTNVNAIGRKQYVCGHCHLNVGIETGYFSDGPKGPGQAGPPRMYICPNCSLPTIFCDDKQIPGVSPGNAVAHVPDQINALYEEARKAVAGGAPTAAVFACRKLLMHIGVAEGAKEGLSFQAYVDHLSATGYVPPNGKGWVDHIRKKGNEANHEIVLMKPEDAMELINFAEMLLKFIYEFPKRVPIT